MAKCFYCEFESGDPTEMALHNIHNHLIKAELSPIKCNTCDLNFETREVLYRHLKSVHGVILDENNTRPIDKESLTSEAQRIINGPRRESYGPVEESFVGLAKIWSGLLSHKLKVDITDKDVSMMMACFKAKRQVTVHGRDNLVDIIGYTLLGGILNNEH